MPEELKALLAWGKDNWVVCLSVVLVTVIGTKALSGGRETVYVAPEPEIPQEFDSTAAIAQVETEQANAESQLFAYLRDERVRELDALARKFEADARVFQADERYSQCFSRDITDCLRSFLASRAVAPDGGVWENARVRMEVEAILLAVLRSTPDTELTAAQRQFVEDRVPVTEGHVGTTPGLLSIQIEALDEISRTRQTAERTARQQAPVAPVIEQQTEGDRSQRQEIPSETF